MYFLDTKCIFLVKTAKTAKTAKWCPESLVCLAERTTSPRWFTSGRWSFHRFYRFYCFLTVWPETRSNAPWRVPKTAENGRKRPFSAVFSSLARNPQ